MIDEKTIVKMNTLANGFAKERVDKFKDEVEGADDEEALKKVLGRMLATAYSKGYADCVEHVGPRRLIF